MATRQWCPRCQDPSSRDPRRGTERPVPLTTEKNSVNSTVVVRWRQTVYRWRLWKYAYKGVKRAVLDKCSVSHRNTQSLLHSKPSTLSVLRVPQWLFSGYLLKNTSELLLCWSRNEFINTIRNQSITLSLICSVCVRYMVLLIKLCVITRDVLMLVYVHFCLNSVFLPATIKCLCEINKAPFTGRDLTPT